MLCVWRIFGPAFAMGVPLRSFLANLINCFASLRATWRYFSRQARQTKTGLAEDRTCLPGAGRSGGTSPRFRRDPGGLRFHFSRKNFAAAKQRVPGDANLGEYLFLKGVLSDEDLCRALSLFTGAPMARFDAQMVKKGVSRSLPARIARQFQIVPVAIAGRPPCGSRTAGAIARANGNNQTVHLARHRFSIDDAAKFRRATATTLISLDLT